LRVIPTHGKLGSLVRPMAIFVRDCLVDLNLPIPAMPVPPVGQVLPLDVLNKHTTWVKTLKEIAGLMLITMDPDIQKKLEPIGAYDMLTERKTLYVQQADQELLQTMREFHEFKQEEGQKGPENQKKKSHKTTKGNQGKGKAKIGYAPVPAPSFAHKPKNPPTPKKDNPAKDAICHQCGEDDIFEIDLSSSNINDSSMYAISYKRAKLNLDSALLWHCRLGHINKKRKEKLQHDGLLDSTDIQSFEKYGAWDYCPPNSTYTPQFNGVSERRNKTVLDMVCFMMSQTTLPKSFWDYALESVARILNMVRTKKVDMTPYKSARTRRAPDRMCLHVDTGEHELGNLGEPANYKAALLDPESEKWLNAMNVELQSMRDNEVWDLVYLPPNDTTIGPKWLFKKKNDMNGTVHTYKSRVVAKGFTQTSGIDYEETFSHVAGIRAIRILITILHFMTMRFGK
nr:putative retrotransposon Ty1-copia subclass protein [Tanacetum cinerariifolium]